MSFQHVLVTVGWNQTRPLLRSSPRHFPPELKSLSFTTTATRYFSVIFLRYVQILLNSSLSQASQTSERNYVFYSEKSLTFQSYQRPGAASKEAEVVNVDDSNLDEFDELTMEELRSLLDNFKNLSKSEQMDLVQYMRKLETTDPEKVRQLKDTTTATAKSNDAPKATRPTNERY